MIVYRGDSTVDFRVKPRIGHSKADVGPFNGIADGVLAMTMSTDPAPQGGWSTWLAKLDEGERARSERFRLPTDRDAFIAAHGLLRHMLCVCHTADEGPASWRFDIDAAGKPTVRHNGLHVSLSHTKGMVACAVGSGVLGIDIENLARQTVFEPSYLSSVTLEEQHMLQNIGAHASHRAFLRLWTLKEALSKAVGTGLNMGFDTVGFDLDPVRMVRGANAQTWQFEQWFPQSGFIAALAVEKCGGNERKIDICPTTACSAWLS